MQTVEISLSKVDLEILTNDFPDKTLSEALVEIIHEKCFPRTSLESIAAIKQ
jgi:hypothetical protein